jgi:glucan phosphoethanolaminetransferase (alkaline phosphatase superfamily)
LVKLGPLLSSILSFLRDEHEENNSARAWSRYCAHTFCAGPGYFFIYTCLLLIGFGFSVTATTITPTVDPDNKYMAVANFFAGILAIYLGAANELNRSFRKHWILMLGILFLLAVFFLFWIVAMGVWQIHLRFSKGIVLITPFITTVPFAGFTYMSTHSDRRGRRDPDEMQRLHPPGEA